MARTKKRQLQWHKASSQWCKRYTDKQTGKKVLVYLGPGTPTREGKGRQDELYDRALDKWLKIKEELDAQKAAKMRGEEIEGLEVMERLSHDSHYWAKLRYRRQQLEDGADLKAVDIEQQHLQKVDNLAHHAVTPDDWRKVSRAITRLDDDAPPRDRSIGKVTEDFITFKLRQVRADQRSTTRYVNLKFYSGWFTKWIGTHTDIALIDCEVIEGYYNHLLDRLGAKDFSGLAARDAFQVAKQVLRWAASKSLIPSLPANIGSRDLVFNNPAGKKITVSIEDARNLFDHATQRTKLFLYLIANTGMTQVDISDLTPDEVDWDRGLITRKRSKTRNQASVDVVTRRLWPETFALLKQFGSRDGERVLLGRNGNPLVYARLADDKEIRADAVAYSFNRLRVTKGVWVKGKTFTNFRSTSATLLQNGGYDHLVSLFLGHAARTTADRSYAANYDSRLDEAIEYLRREYLIRPLPSDRGSESIQGALFTDLSTDCPSLLTA